MNPAHSLIFVALAIPFTSCSQPGTPAATDDFTVRMTPADFVTDQTPDVPIVIELTNIRPWQSVEEFTRGELPSWHANSRVVRWPSREAVEGRWIFSNAAPYTLRFEPNVSLPVGWFAVQVRFSELPVRRGTATSEAFERGLAPQYWDDGWVTTRFHVGSLPIVALIGGIEPATDGRDSGGSFSLYVTEAIVLDADLPLDGLLTVTLDGEPVRCVPWLGDGVVLPADGHPFGGVRWDCTDVPHAGRVDVTLRLLEGTPASLRYAGTGTPPTWTGQTGRPFSNSDLTDAFFTEHVQEAP